MGTLTTVLMTFALLQSQMPTEEVYNPTTLTAPEFKDDLDPILWELVTGHVLPSRLSQGVLCEFDVQDVVQRAAGWLDTPEIANTLNVRIKLYGILYAWDVTDWPTRLTFALEGIEDSYSGIRSKSAEMLATSPQEFRGEVASALHAYLARSDDDEFQSIVFRMASHSWFVSDETATLINDRATAIGTSASLRAAANLFSRRSQDERFRTLIQSGLLEPFTNEVLVSIHLIDVGQRMRDGGSYRNFAAAAYAIDRYNHPDSSTRHSAAYCIPVVLRTLKQDLPGREKLQETHDREISRLLRDEKDPLVRGVLDELHRRSIL